MKTQELQKLIREEIKKTLSEANKLESSVADLYAWAGIKKQYSDDAIKRYGQKVVDLAIQMAPKILAYETKLKKMVKDIKSSPEAKMLMKVIEEAGAYGGSDSEVTVGDLVSQYDE